MNEKYQNYFNNGLAKEALLGEGSFFSCFYPGDQEHNIGFVLDQLMEWAELTHREKEVALIIEQTIPLFFQKKDLLLAVRSIWCVIRRVTVHKEWKFTDFNMDVFGNVLLNFCIQHPDLVNQNDEIRGMIELICEHEPIIAKILGADVTKFNSPKYPF